MRCRSTGSTISPTRSWRKSCRPCPASRKPASSASSLIRCVSRSIPARSPRRASASRMCAPRSRRRPWTGPRASSKAQHQTYTLDANDQLFNAGHFGNVIIAYRNGAPVRVKDSATRPTPSRTSAPAPGISTPPAEGLAIQRAGRRQHDRAGRHGQGDDSAAQAVDPAFGPCRARLRPLAGGPRGGARRAVHDGADRAWSSS